jgi:hypothetical protein
MKLAARVLQAFSHDCPLPAPELRSDLFAAIWA